MDQKNLERLVEIEQRSKSNTKRLDEHDKELKELSLKSPYSLLISQDYKALDRMFENEYMIRHENDREISLSVRSSIILSVAYHLKRSL